jgi:histidine triad (HIT) family protein
MARVLRDALHPDGMNVIQANERAGFQSVFHLHFHIIPRWIGDGLRLPWQPRPGNLDAIAETATRIRAAAVDE